MSKYIASKEALDSNLLMWDIRPTQTSIEEKYEINVYPATIYDGTYGAPIDFDLPSQPNGCLYDIDISTTWQVKKGDAILAANDNVSIINNFSNALWSYVDIQVGNRVNIMQSMEQAYGYQTFFNTVLNSSSNRTDYLYQVETFFMDTGDDKNDAECVIFFDDDKTKIKNKGGEKRANRIKLSREITSKTKLHTPLLNHSKVLPPNMNIKVTLAKNKDKFLLLSGTGDHKVVIKSAHLICTYLRPKEVVLNLMEERLKQTPALYDIEYPQISMKTIPINSTQYTLYDFFPSKLPKAAFFALIASSDLAGGYKKNPFTFHRLTSFQLFVDNREFFNFPIKFVDRQNDTLDFSQAYIQLFKTLGLDRSGDCLINSENFNINYMIGAVLTADKSHLNHLNLQKTADVRVELELDGAATEPMVLVTYALYDKLYSIDSDRQLKITE